MSLQIENLKSEVENVQAIIQKLEQERKYVTSLL